MKPHDDGMQALPPLGPHDGPLGDLFAGARDDIGTGADEARLAASLGALLAAPPAIAPNDGGAGAGTSGVKPTGGTPTVGGAATGTSGLLGAGLLGAGVLAAGLLAFGLYTAFGSSATPAPTPSAPSAGFVQGPPVRHDGPSSFPTPTASADAAPTATGTDSKVGTASSDEGAGDTPAVRPSSAAVPRAATRPQTEEPEPTAAAPTAPPKGPGDLELLMQARQSLKTNPQRALALARQHHSLYPTSALAQERAVIEMSALRQLGKGDEVKKSADAFKKQYPGSAHGRRVDALKE